MFDKRAIKVTTNYVKSNFEQIKVTAGDCRFNYKCHMNSVHDAVRSGHKRLAMCIYLGDDSPIIHFVNVTNDGVFVDNTLGEWSRKYKYYLVRYINEEEFFEIDKTFGAFRNDMRRILGWLRPFSSLIC